jgi:hypothetical protein
MQNLLVEASTPNPVCAAGSVGGVRSEFRVHLFYGWRVFVCQCDV